MGTSTAVVVNAINSPSNLVPGGTPQPITFRINNTQTQAQYVTSVSISVSGVTKAVGAPAGACAPDDFTVAQPSAINADLSAGTHDYDASYAATIQMVNKATPQDGCKNATITLALAAV